MFVGAGVGLDVVVGGVETGVWFVLGGATVWAQMGDEAVVESGVVSVPSENVFV